MSSNCGNEPKFRIAFLITLWIELLLFLLYGFKFQRSNIFVIFTKNQLQNFVGISLK